MYSKILFGRPWGAPLLYAINPICEFNERWIQVINATSPLLLIACKYTPFGDKKPNLFLCLTGRQVGRLFKISSSSCNCFSVIKLKSVPFRKYCLISPFRFSFTPLFQLQ